MSSHTPYIFSSARLGFRNWVETDIKKMAAINANKEVMEFFPAVQNEAETLVFIKRMQQMYADKGFCYFAVDTLHNNEFIGFIGLAEKTFEADFTPCVDIGWRLHPSAWNKGYATEGAKACLDYGLETLQLKKIYAMAPVINIKSEQVMIKAGMQKKSVFYHPLLLENKKLRECVLYEKVGV